MVFPLSPPPSTRWIFCRAVRSSILFSTKSSSSKEPLHQVLQRHLLKNDASKMTTSQLAVLKFSTDGKQTTEHPSVQRSSNHHYTSVQERSRMQQQAIINGLIAFSVVILACQNLKAGVEKRQIQEQLQQQEEQFHALRQTLQQLLQRPHLDSLAAEIVQELEAPFERSSIRVWFRHENSRKDSSNPDCNTAQRIADRLEQHLHNIVGDAAMDESERDLKKVQALTTHSQPIKSISKEVEILSDSVTMDEVLAALQDENSFETGPKVVKKRLFSM
jgi:hypothetical protein